MILHDTSEFLNEWLDHIGILKEDLYLTQNVAEITREYIIVMC